MPSNRKKGLRKKSTRYSPTSLGWRPIRNENVLVEPNLEKPSLQETPPNTFISGRSNLPWQRPCEETLPCLEIFEPLHAFIEALRSI